VSVRVRVYTVRKERFAIFDS